MDRTVTLSQTTGTGLASAEGLGPKAMMDGIYPWNDLQTPTAGIITVTVTDNTAPTRLTVISEDINIVTTLPIITVTDTPLLNFGEVDNRETSTTQNFTVAGSDLLENITVEVEATSGFEISLEAGANFGSSIALVHSSGTLTGGTVTVYVRFAPSSGTTNGQVTADITLNTSGAVEQTVSVMGTETGNPAFTVTGVLSDFGEVNNGETSADGDVQSFDVVGTDLTANIKVAAPENFEVSLEAAASFMSSVDLTKEADGTLTSTTVYVRFSPTSGTNGKVTSDITLSTEDAADQTVSVSGTTVVVDPSFTVTGTLEDFGEVNNGETSESQSFTVKGENLTGDITVTAPGGFEVSLEAVANFASSVDLVVPEGGTLVSTPVYVRFAPSSGSGANVDVAADIELSTEGADDQAVSVTGTAAVIPPVTGIGQESLKYNISVYPNPSEEVFHIAIPESFGTGEVKLVSLDGAVVQKGTIGKMKQIETSNLRRGIYLLQILNATTVVNYRVVVK